MPQSSDPPKKPSKSSIKLWPEQQDALEFCLSVPNTALFCEQRTGKTYITLKLIEELADNNFCGVIVSLLANRDSTWLDKTKELLPWIGVTHDWDEFKAMKGPKLFLIHYEFFVTIVDKLVRYKKINWMCIDEAQRIANRGTKQSRCASRMSWVARKLILTGTPIEKQPIDMFGQFRFLDPDVFGKNWSEFEEYYMEWPEISFEHAPRGSALWQQKILQQRILKNKATFREERRDEFMAAIGPMSIRLTKKDVGILEPIVHKVLVGMSRNQRRCYEEMLKQSFTYLPRGQRVLAELTITNIAKRRQIATGFVYDDEREIHHLSNTKLKKLVSLVGELSKPIVVFTAFRPDNDKVTERLRKEGYDVAQVNGKTKKNLRPQIWRDFQRGQYDVVVVQVKVGGTGVDLWKASNAIVYSMGHSFRDWDQALSRLDSKEKTKPSEFFVLCARNSIDEELFDLVIVKKFTSEQVMSKLKKGLSSWQKLKQTKLPRNQQPKRRRLRIRNTR